MSIIASHTINSASSSVSESSCMHTGHGSSVQSIHHLHTIGVQALILHEMAAEHEPADAGEPVVTLVVLGGEKTGKKTLIQKVGRIISNGRNPDILDSSTIPYSENNQTQLFTAES